jgi:glutathione synthase/RimK-type ligase-like ATP-grasp enzyme
MADVRSAPKYVPCPVVNRPSAGRSNASKPYQMAELEAAGFDVPRWIVSNSAQAVCAFTSECGGHAIYKASSGLRSRVRMVDTQFIERLNAGTTPTVIQEYVPGADVRVHTVERDVFACQVSSEGVDYRFEHQGTSYERTSIPNELAEQCCAFAEAAGLILAGLDFRRTPDGRYRCLEMNPVPSFLPYEFSSGLPIGASVVNALTRRAADRLG